MLTLFCFVLSVLASPFKPGQAYSAGLPWQNGFAERLIGSIRRECVDHFIVLGETHVRRILRACAHYYNEIRTHRSWENDAPVSRPVQRTGTITSRRILGGLRHQRAVTVTYGCPKLHKSSDI
jgi:hypothetical protein